MHATTVKSLETDLRVYRASEGLQSLQKISAGISLVVLALGFSFIGLRSLIHRPVAGDSLAFSATSCVVGGWAGLAAGTIFLGVAFVYWRRYFLFSCSGEGDPKRSSCWANGSETSYLPGI